MIGELFTPMHLLVLLFLILLLFGGKAFSRLGKGFREGVQNFRVNRK